ncbi:MAG: carboxypeptidase-like regulatory domain-containing protein, partial [Chitinophagales bacterium]
MLSKKWTLLLFSLLTYGILGAQSITQTIKGKVIDNQSNETLPGANVIVVGSNPVIGTSTDANGEFKLLNIPVGRVTLQISLIGYEMVVLHNLELTSGKELYVEVGMIEQIILINEVVISASQGKAEAINEMSTVSTRQFSIEESQRFAGARNDVSRMAQNFAGVRGANDAVNDIVIRGNSPVGLLWRLEGIDIPNPNHFGDFGSTGGPVSMLNNNVLANSDFLTGAFPAEYGNAVSGVFDLRMRKGNNEKHEFLGQIGLNGLELGAEGPFSKNSKASYLINYRYSTLGVMSALGINFGTGTAIPFYQDIAFNLNFPTEKAGILNVWGLGGINEIDLISSNAADTVDNLYANDVDVFDRSKIGVIGATHTYLFNNSAYTKFSIAASTIINKDQVDSISTETGEPVDFYFQNYTLNRIA